MRASKWVALATAGALGVLSLKAARSYVAVASEFNEFRRVVSPPTDRSGLEGLIDVNLSGDSGRAIRGWYVPAKNRAVVVLAHGSPSTRVDLLPEARVFGEAGYGVVLFDFPGHGESEGKATWGTPAVQALRAAVTFASARPEVDPRRIGALGFSMGSWIVAEAAASDPRIAAVILDGAYTNLSDQLRFEYRSWGPISGLPAVWAAANAGLAVNHSGSMDFVGRVAPRPILFVIGTVDPVVPPHMAVELFAAANDPKELYVVAGAGHGRYGEVAGRTYFDRIVRFFDRSLRGIPAMSRADVRHP